MVYPRIVYTDVNRLRLLAIFDSAGEFSTAMCLLSSRLLQLLKRGLARVGTRLTAEPPHHPREVDDGRAGTMLQVRFREADIARAAQATGTDAVRERVQYPRIVYTDVNGLWLLAEWH